MIDGNTSSTCFASASIFYARLVRKEGKWECPKCVIYSLFFISSCSPQMMDDCRKYFFSSSKSVIGQLWKTYKIADASFVASEIVLEDLFFSLQQKKQTKGTKKG